MTTTQTIDGVPRERIQEIICDIERGGRITAVEKLRALLDGPAKEQQWVSVEAFNRVSTELEELKAGQHQGEPVAWRFRVSDTGDWFATTKPLVAEMFHNSSDGGQAQPLYAEQPAPVAVVLSGGRRSGKAHLAAQLESLAQQIYQSWESQPGFVPWVEGGNSTKQDEARQIASRTFELALANQVED